MAIGDKPHANTDEILALIHIRRESAVASMRQVIECFKGEAIITPRVEPLLSYLMNMCFCIELCLKLLADNWKTHDIESMYISVFGDKTDQKNLLGQIKNAIKDQKYLHAPSGEIANHIPEIESLFDECHAEVRKKYLKYRIEIAVTCSTRVGEWLKDNAHRFYSTKSPTYSESNPQPTGWVEDLMSQSHKELCGLRANIDKYLKMKNSLDFETHKCSIS